MPNATFIKAHQKPAPNSRIHFQVLLDDTQLLPDGSPNPEYLKEWHWSPQPPNWTGATLNGTTYTDYNAYIAAETQLLAAHHLAQMQAEEAANATVLPMQGTTFNA